MSEFLQSDKIAEAKAAVDRLRANMRLVIVGKDDVIEQLLVCLAASEHLLQQRDAQRERDQASQHSQRPHHPARANQQAGQSRRRRHENEKRQKRHVIPSIG